MEEIMNIGDRIKKVRKINQLNQSQFAHILGISQTHISKIESNKDIPSDKILRTIEIEFNINFEWLKYGTGLEEASTDSKERLLKNSLREVKMYLDNCTDIEFMTFSTALSSLLNIWKAIVEQQGTVSEKIVIVSDMLTSMESGIKYLATETKKIKSSGINSKIDENFFVSDKYESKIMKDFDMLKNLFLGEGE